MAYFPNYFKGRGTVKALPVTDALTDFATPEFLSDVSSYACSGTNIAAQTVSGSVTVTGAVVTYDPGTITWTSVSCTNVGYIILYIDTGNSATSPLIGYADVRDGGAGRNIINQDLAVTWPANGIRVHVW